LRASDSLEVRATDVSYVRVSYVATAGWLTSRHYDVFLQKAPRRIYSDVPSWSIKDLKKLLIKAACVRQIFLKSIPLLRLVLLNLVIICSFSLIHIYLRVSLNIFYFEYTTRNYNYKM
jgi:hypothetical protein